MSRVDEGNIGEQLSQALQYHTSHNYRPPSHDDPFGQVRLSPALEHVITDYKESFHTLSRRPAIQPGPVDDSLPLHDYFISSSHNTYLLSRQLIGKASAASYTHVLTNAGICVEIDVWPSDNGLVVTHGYTFTTDVPFSDVCRAIGDIVTPDCWPVFVSLECHVPVEGQRELVRQMVDAWGDKLVKGPVNCGKGEVTPADLKGRIILIVEYISPERGELEDDGEDPIVGEQGKHGFFSWIFNKETEEKAEVQISDELSEYGFYAHSMKPMKGWLSQSITGPANILINISESAYMQLLPTSQSELISHSCRHLRRVYPKGSRVDSSNLDPLAFWRSGTQIAGLNWQIYDKGMQIHEAMFVGSPGWIPKPKQMRKGLNLWAALVKKKQRLVIEIVGASSLPAPNGCEGKTFSTYIQAQLFHEGEDLEWCSRSVETQHDVKVGADVIWQEQLEWYYEADDIAFLRLLVCEHEMGKDDHIGIFCAKLDHIVKEKWVLLRMLTDQGKNSGATVLARFTTYTLS